MSRADSGHGVEIDGLDYRPVPQSWVDHGTVVDHRGGDATHFATLAAIDALQEEVVVRYCHPVNETVVVERFDGLPNPTGDGWIPAPLLEDEWPRRVPHHSHDPANDLPRHGEVDLIPERHDLSDTAYDPDSAVGPDPWSRRADR